MVYLTNSGSEANELAMLMARLHTGNFDIINFRYTRLLTQIHAYLHSLSQTIYIAIIVILEYYQRNAITCAIHVSLNGILTFTRRKSCAGNKFPLKFNIDIVSMVQYGD